LSETVKWFSRILSGGGGSSHLAPPLVGFHTPLATGPTVGAGVDALVSTRWCRRAGVDALVSTRWCRRAGVDALVSTVAFRAPESRR
jgi:hypothetical protein